MLGKAGLIVIPLLVALTTLGAANGSIFAGTRYETASMVGLRSNRMHSFLDSRIFYVAARGGQLPDMFSGVHRTYKTPMPATLLHVG